MGVTVAAMEVCPRNPLGWVLGVEVEREPLDCGAEPALEPLGRPLAEPAVGSDVVRPDQKLVRHHMVSVVGETVPS